MPVAKYLGELILAGVIMKCLTIAVAPLLKGTLLRTAGFIGPRGKSTLRRFPVSGVAFLLFVLALVLWTVISAEKIRASSEILWIAGELARLGEDFGDSELVPLIAQRRHLVARSISVFLGMIIAYAAYAKAPRSKDLGCLADKGRAVATALSTARTWLRHWSEGPLDSPSANDGE